MKYKYIGAIDEQVYWGNCDDPRNVLEIGEEYLLKRLDIHNWHTRIVLEEFPGMEFNSVCFEKVDNDELPPMP